MNLYRVDLRYVQQCLLIAFVVQTQQEISYGNNNFDEKAVAAVQSVLKLQNSINDDEYGNVHFELIETEQTTSRKIRTVTEIKYWARGNQYFRLDTKIKESNDPKKSIGARNRLILGPEGFIAMVANTAQAPFTIHRWGSYEEGLARLSGYSFFRAATRSFSVLDASSILRSVVTNDLGPHSSNEIENHREIKSITISEDEKYLTIQSTWSSTSNVANSNITFEITHGAVTNYRGQIFKEDLPVNLTTAQKKYDYVTFRSIPSHHFEKLERADGSGYSRILETKHVDWVPVPLGIFSLEAQGLASLQPQSVWTRRILILFAGIIMFFVVYLIKRAKYRAS